MKDEDFEKLVTSVKQMRAMMRGEGVPHKCTSYPPTDVKVLRKRLNLTQEKFAAMSRCQCPNTTELGTGSSRTRGAGKGFAPGCRTATRSGLGGASLVDHMMHQRPDRAMIQEEWIQRVIDQPVKEVIQQDGRIRRWAPIAEMEGRYLRVILLPDGETVHNAFFDRRFTL